MRVSGHVLRLRLHCACALPREWQHGDKVEVSLGLTYWLKPLGDNREQYKDLQAVMSGPYVMAGVEDVGAWERKTWGPFYNVRGRGALWKM